MLIRLRFAIGLLLLFFVSTLWAEVAVPPLAQRVTDLTDTLSSSQTRILENQLAALEAKKGSQIAVLILPTTQPETIEAFSIRVADNWKIGRKNIDDGVILLIAKDDRKLRIEVGRGLEGVIPDAIAKRVIDEIITPKFRLNNFYAGIDDGIGQLIKLIDGESLPAPVPTAKKDFDILDFRISEWVVYVLVICFIGLDLLFSSLFGDTKGTFCTALATGLVSAGFSLFADFTNSVTIIIGAIMFGLGLIASFFVKLARSIDYSSTRDDFSSSSSWSSGGFSSGSSWSSGGSSWSGGGGGFSGGGASGSW